MIAYQMPFCKSFDDQYQKCKNSTDKDFCSVHLKEFNLLNKKINKISGNLSKDFDTAYSQVKEMIQLRLELRNSLYSPEFYSIQNDKIKILLVKLIAINDLLQDKHKDLMVLIVHLLTHHIKDEFGYYKKLEQYNDTFVHLSILIKKEISESRLLYKLPAFDRIIYNLIFLAVIILDDRYQADNIYSIGIIEFNRQPPNYILRTILKIIFYNQGIIWKHLAYIGEMNGNGEPNIIALVAEVDNFRHIICGLRNSTGKFSFESNFLKVEKSKIIDQIDEHKKCPNYRLEILNNSDTISAQELFGKLPTN